MRSSLRCVRWAILGVCSPVTCAGPPKAGGARALVLLESYKPLVKSNHPATPIPRGRRLQHRGHPSSRPVASQARSPITARERRFDGLQSARQHRIARDGPTERRDAIDADACGPEAAVPPARAASPPCLSQGPKRPRRTKRPSGRRALCWAAGRRGRSRRRRKKSPGTDWSGSRCAPRRHARRTYFRNLWTRRTRRSSRG